MRACVCVSAYGLYFILLVIYAGSVKMLDETSLTLLLLCRTMVFIPAAIQKQMVQREPPLQGLRPVTVQRS